MLPGAIAGNWTPRGPSSSAPAAKPLKCVGKLIVFLEGLWGCFLGFKVFFQKVRFFCLMFSCCLLFILVEGFCVNRFQVVSRCSSGGFPMVCRGLHLVFSRPSTSSPAEKKNGSSQLATWGCVTSALPVPWASSAKLCGRRRSCKSLLVGTTFG